MRSRMVVMEDNIPGLRKGAEDLDHRRADPGGEENRGRLSVGGGPSLRPPRCGGRKGQATTCEVSLRARGFSGA